MALRATVLPRRPQLAPTLCRQALVRDALTRAPEPSDAVFMLHREMMTELKRELTFQRGELERTVARERKLIAQGAAGAHGLFEQASVALRDVEIALAFVADLIGSGA